MLCPCCKKADSQVIDSREVDGTTIRRRRECPRCKYRFTTYERLEPLKLTVIKRDGRTEPYNREKIKKGIQIACQKRVSPRQIEDLTDEIEQALIATGKTAVSSRQIGQIVMEKLKKIDEIGYLRFVAIYKGFKSAKSLEKEIAKIKSKKP